MASTEVSTGNNFEVKQLGDGKYEVTQIKPERNSAELNSANRKEIQFSAGPLEVHGYYDPDTQTIGAYPSFGGMQIGDGYAASLQDGLQIQIVLVLYNGGLRFFKSGNQLRVEVHLKPVLPWGDDINAGTDLFEV